MDDEKEAPRRAIRLQLRFGFRRRRLHFGLEFPSPSDRCWLLVFFVLQVAECGTRNAECGLWIVDCGARHQGGMGGEEQQGESFISRELGW